MPKPLGGVSSIFVVVRLSFSVGTASVNSCSAFDFVTGGLISACAHALGTAASAAVAVARPKSARTRTVLTCTRSPFVVEAAAGAAADVRSAGADRGRRGVWRTPGGGRLHVRVAGRRG